MELAIAGRWALVCAASKGLGKGCAEALVAEGVNVVINARSSALLEETAEHLRDLNPAVSVHTVAGDIALAETRQSSVGGLPPNRYSDHQCGGAAAWGLSRLVARGLVGGRQRQHADAYRADQSNG